jgi:hypothetical protein
MQTSSPKVLILLATAALISCAGSASAQSNVRDFGPSTYRRVVRPAPAYYNGPNYAAAPIAAYASPYTQVAFQPIASQQPVGCAYNTANNAYRPYAANPHVTNPYAYGPYTAGFAPYSGGNTSYWSSTTPAQYTGNTLFGSPTVYGKEQPFRNVLRFFAP